MYERRYDLLASKFNEFFLPTLFTSMAGNICLFVDSLIVSFLIGSANLSAIQVVTPIVTFVNLIYWLIGLGGSVLASISKSEFDEDGSNYYFTVSVVSLVILGILVMVIGLVFMDGIVYNLTNTTQIIPLVKEFFKYLLIGMPFLCYMMSLSYFIRADGIPNLPFKAILLSNVANIVLDFVYIKFLGLGIGGASLATATGYILGSIFISVYFFKSERTLKLLNLGKIKIKSFLNHLKEICVSGFSSSSTQLFFTIKLFIYNNVIGFVLGKLGLMSFSICFNSTFILYIFLIGSAQTMSPIVSVYNQEEDYAGVNYIVKKALKISLISSLILSLLFIFVPQIILTLYNVHDPQQIPVTVNAIRIFAISFVGVAVTFLFTFYTQAIKNNRLSVVISTLEGCILPILALFILTPIIGSNGIWISFIVAEIVTIIIIYLYSKYKSYKTKGEYGGFFINKTSSNDEVLDLSIENDINQAVGVAYKVESYLKDLNIDKKRAMIVGLSIEEMLVNIIRTNKDIKTIDILVKIQENHILIGIKDQGIEFNPSLELESDNVDYSFENITVLNKIADKIDYARVLGLNSTVITIEK